MHKVFVYGSLKQGYHNHPHFLGNSELMAQHTTEPKYTLHNLGAFPAVTLNGNTAIVGEVYDVDDETFRRLDRLEGYPHFYNRKTIDTPHGDAWMYYLEKCDNDVVESGEW